MKMTDKNKFKKKEVEIEDVYVLDASIPSELLIIVKDTHANIRIAPTHIANRVKKVNKGTKLSFDKIVTGGLVQNSDQWYKVEGGYIHSSQVEEVNEVIK
jgi:hypothetical protein